MYNYIDGTATVPLIEDEELSLLAQRIEPFIRRFNRLNRIKPVDLRRVSFAWDPQIAGPVAECYDELARIQTNHRCGYYGLFKPSIAEVLSQIPIDLHDKTAAFEVNFSKIDVYKDATGHRAEIILYSHKHKPVASGELYMAVEA